ncbi:MAG TPA: alanine dehydrogenase [Casimicrobiaceae bacterium]
MRIGVPRETKDGERRVAMTPAGVRELVHARHQVAVEQGAGRASGFADAEYADAGATLEADAAAVWQSELVVKVKEVQRPELPLLARGTTLVGFAQLVGDPGLVAALAAAGVNVIAAESVRDADGELPILAPMSRIAGRLAPLAGAEALCHAVEGGGTLITGVDDVPPARVVVIGAGNVGREAAHVAAELGCHVHLWSRGGERLARTAHALARARTPVITDRIGRSAAEFADAIATADLVIGAVLEPGAASPTLITRAMLKSMRRGAALVDVCIDHGGIAETSRLTTLSDPMYVDEGVVHYAVPNMPARVPRTATQAYAAALLPRVARLAAGGIGAALDADRGLAAGVMIWDGTIVDPGLASMVGVRAARRPWQHGALAA